MRLCSIGKLPLLVSTGCVICFCVYRECCSGCGVKGFQHGDKSIELMKLALDRGHMVMVSDFSAKALIADWEVF